MCAHTTGKYIMSECFYFNIKIYISNGIIKLIVIYVYVYFMLQKFFKNKKIKETKIKTKEHNNRQNINICIRNLDTNKERQEAIEHF